MKKELYPEVVLELLVGIGRHAQGPDLQELGVEEGLGMGLDVLDEGADQVLRLAAAGADEDPVAGVDAAEDDVLCGELVRILLCDLLEPGIQFFRGHWFVTLSITVFRNRKFNEFRNTSILVYIHCQREKKIHTDAKDGCRNAACYLFLAL